MAALQQQAVEQLLTYAPVLTPLAELFAQAGHELAIVGGPVRDALLGRLPDGADTDVDLDLTTDARPERILQIVAGWADTHWDLGRAFGTIGLRKGRFVIEITTYRADSYDGTTRKPTVEFGDSLDGDLARRDLTVNAMAVRLPGRQFVDLHDGMADLAGGLLRTPVEPRVSFGDDPLRMMRVARFVGQLGFDVDPATRAAMRDLADRLQIVSAERISTELSKLLLGSHVRAGLEVFVDTGLADQVIPELTALKLTVDEHRRHKDVYEHTLTVLEQAIDLEARNGPDGPVPGPDLVLRLAAVLHDIGKPATRRFEAGGGVSFHHHEVVGAKLAAKRLRALKFDKQTVTDVARLVELHLRFHGYADGDNGWTDSAVRRYVTDAGPLLERLHLLTRADCTTRNRRKAARLAAAYDDLEQRIAVLREAEELAAIRPDLDGTEIMAILAIAPGRVVGRAYRHLLELRMDHGPLGTDRARAELLAWWAEQPESRQ
jgi:poly(A) polymerase